MNGIICLTMQITKSLISTKEMHYSMFYYIICSLLDNFLSQGKYQALGVY